MCFFPVSCCGIQMRWLVVIMCIFCHIMINFIADEGLHGGLLWQVKDELAPFLSVGCQNSIQFRLENASSVWANCGYGN
ncbi:hypothetical protein AAC387_Pa07g0246 [Persea americana]